VQNNRICGPVRTFPISAEAPITADIARRGAVRRATPFLPREAASSGSGSQTGSQRRQEPGDVRLSPATITAAKRLIEPRPATPGDGPEAPCKRTVSGSNPLTGSLSMSLTCAFVVDTLSGRPPRRACENPVQGVRRNLNHRKQPSGPTRNSAPLRRERTPSSKHGRSSPGYAAALGEQARSPRPSTSCKLTRSKQDENGSMSPTNRVPRLTTAEELGWRIRHRGHPRSDGYR